MKEYTAKYFEKATKVIKEHLSDSITTLQFFQRKNNSIFSGINEVIKLLEENTDTSKYEIWFLEEGTEINENDIVLQLKGNYSEFGQFEGVIDGIFSRMTSLATNAHRIVKCSNGKQIIFMGDRMDHYLLQPLDGYAVSLGGIKTQVTDAQIKLHDGISVGTMPHALIQAFEGNLVNALIAYKKTFPNEPLTALVDFNNDVIGDSLKCLKEFGQDLLAVRVDTPQSSSDAMFKDNEEFGVTPNMIKRLRKALNENDGRHVKIIVSSGFDEKKIKLFEKENTPVDCYGVGSSIMKINNTFTADAVEINEKKIAKFGRSWRDISKLRKYNNKI